MSLRDVAGSSAAPAGLDPTLLEAIRSGQATQAAAERLAASGRLTADVREAAARGRFAEYQAAMAAVTPDDVDRAQAELAVAPTKARVGEALVNGVALAAFEPVLLAMSISGPDGGARAEQARGTLRPFPGAASTPEERAIEAIGGVVATAAVTSLVTALSRGVAATTSRSVQAAASASSDDVVRAVGRVGDDVAGSEFLDDGLRMVDQPLTDAAGEGGRIAHLRGRVRELGYDPDRASVVAREGIAGARLEAHLGRQIRRGDRGADFIDDAPAGLGRISLKGPLPRRVRGNAEGLARAAVDDLAKNSGADTLVVDLTGLDSTAASTVQRRIFDALPNANFPKNVIYIRR